MEDLEKEFGSPKTQTLKHCDFRKLLVKKKFLINFPINSCGNTFGRLSIIGQTVANAVLQRYAPANPINDVRHLQEQVPLGDPENRNEGITWFGSQFTGPGNRVLTADGRYAANSLPKLPNDWVTLEYDVDYHNTSQTNKNAIWELDKKAIAASLGTTDPYLGNIATAVGLVVKNIAERTHESITGSAEAIYPNKGDVNKPHIPWFDKHESISRRVLSKYPSHASPLPGSAATATAELAVFEFGATGVRNQTIQYRP